MRLWISGLALAALTAFAAAGTPAAASPAQALTLKPALGQASAVEKARHWRKRWRHRHIYHFGWGYPYYGYSHYLYPRRYGWRHRHLGWYGAYGRYGYGARWYGYRPYW